MSLTDTIRGYQPMDTTDFDMYFCSLFNIEHRHIRTVNTDPQRRCYNGCHYSSEQVWSEWGVIEYEVPIHKVNRRMEFWQEINGYAVSQRGDSARKEFRTVAVKQGELK